MTQHTTGRIAALITLLALPTTLAAVSGGTANAAGNPRRASVYVLSNATTGNQVLRYQRADDGTLTPAGNYATGGNGSGAGLGSQGAVVLSDDGRTLLAVNAGSNSISQFDVQRDGTLRLVDTEPSDGAQPISVTVHDDTVYVLNNGDNEIVGFNFDPHYDGLTPIPGATQTLSGTGGAQVEFSPSGRQLVVTEKASNLIDVFAVDSHGVAGTAIATPSTGATPFGFAFTRGGVLVVSNAAGGAPGASSASSYVLDRSGAANFVAGGTANGQTAACWTVISSNSRYAYTTNTGSSTISGYRVGRLGDLTPLNADGVTATTGAGSRPLDAAVAGDYLYTRNGGTNTITIHHVERDGSLTAVATVTGLPAAAVGLAAA